MPESAGWQMAMPISARQGWQARLKVAAYQAKPAATARCSAGAAYGSLRNVRAG